jgi:hypothetical protein
MGETDQGISIYNAMRKLLAITDRILIKMPRTLKKAGSNPARLSPPIEH